jgi:hypothetical protein
MTPSIFAEGSPGNPCRAAKNWPQMAPYKSRAKKNPHPQKREVWHPGNPKKPPEDGHSAFA